MSDHRLPKRAMSGELENVVKRGPGGRIRKSRTALQRVVKDCSSTIAPDPGAW